jgi:dihydrofolate synthase / folylpolyglutamate synthase
MGLTRVTAVARALGVDKLSSAVITVAGTNGKGSTVVHTDSFLRAAGASTGMFTSPHFIRYNERIRVNGVDVSDDELVDAFERIEKARGTTTLTFFEFNALAALVIFADRKVDVSILEVGLGGRLDAVNLLDADVGVVCSIGLDHRDYLGDTLEQIGAEKAGIFRTGRPAVLGTDELPATVFQAIASLKARQVLAGKDFTWNVKADGRWSYKGLRLSLNDLPPSALNGSIQYRNAATALAAIESLPRRFELTERMVSDALQSVRLIGRFQVVSRPAASGGSVEWILDIAHNEPAAVTFAQHVRERPLPAVDKRQEAGKTFAVVGILGDKDAQAIGVIMDPLVDRWILCALPGARGTSAEQLAERLRLAATKVTLATSVDAGCEMASHNARPGDRVLVFGSFHTVGPAMQWLQIY